jgi:NAD(P)-dependent dehydrogenase (short-subunit alcohol dehydrogenase family)
MARLAGKTAIITGGASGMGLATARLFLAEGANVVIADLSPGESDALALTMPKRAHFVPCDVRHDEAIAGMCAATAERFGGIDILFNNAGYIGMTDGIATMTAEGWDGVFSGLLRGPALAMHHALPWLQQSGGTVINTASTAGVDIGWGPMAYSVAKHALIYLTKWAAAELAPSGIRVNAITPGLILTPLLGTANGLPADVAGAVSVDPEAADVAKRFQPLRRAGRPHDIAEAALYLASDASAFVTGMNLIVDGGVTIGERHVWDSETPPPSANLRALLASRNAGITRP